ncbi:MAG: TolB family protein [Vicinamibacterales bacterium]
MLCGIVEPVVEGQVPAPPYGTDTIISSPRPYAESVLTTVNGIAFAPGGRTLYVSRWVDGLDYRGRRRTRIFAHHFVDGQWSAAEPVSFSREFTDYQPVLSPDGSRLFFTSTRPLPGTDTETRQNIWYVDGTGGMWGPPQIVENLATPGWDGYAVPTRRGRLYFVSDRPGGRGAVDIWVADTTADGRYGEPVNVTALNSEHSDSDIFVDPEERYVIFHRSVEATRTVEFWIAFGAAGDWRAPRLLEEVNGPGWELSPTVPPDGRYLFFNRDSVILQVDFCALIRTQERRFLQEFNDRRPVCPAP